MRQHITLIFFICLPVFYGISQESGNRVCGTETYYEAQKKAHPELEQLEKLANERAKAYAEKPQAQQKRQGDPRVIPVVFRVIHGGGEENLSRQQILDNLERLNVDFQKRNEDTADVRPIFKDRIADYNIEFRLARKTPEGECFNGITREYHPDLTDNILWLNEIPNYTDRINYWNREHYLNIWIVEDIYDNNPNSDIAGQANYPWSDHGADGIIMRADQIEYQDRTLTHEAGHYLGLYHPFRHGCETGDCENQNDKVCDVPPTADRETVTDCSQIDNTCSDTSGLPDMKENYMDYTNCRMMFSEGQKQRSDAYLYDTQYRQELISDQNLARTGVKDQINGAPLADFMTTDTEVCEGNQIQFESLGCAGTPDSIEWYFEGGTPETSGSENPVVRYDKPGQYDVSLKLINGDGTDSILKTDYIEILESATPPVNYQFQEENPETLGFRMDTNQMGNRWKRTEGVGAGDNHSLYLSNYNITEEQDVAFRLPPVNLTNITDPVLRFDMAYATKSDNSSDILVLQNSSDCAQNWDHLTFLFNNSIQTKSEVQSPYFPESTEEWKTHKVSLDDLKADTNAIIRFIMQTSEGNNAFIDNIRIERESTNIDAPKAKTHPEFQFYPNPVHEQLTIEYPGKHKMKSKLRIFNTLGHQTDQRNIDWNPGEIKKFAPSELGMNKPGIYIIRIQTKEQTVTKSITLTR